MSLATLTKSLHRFVSNSRNFSKPNFASTKHHLQTFDFISSDASVQYSLKITKKIALMCNANFLKDSGARLLTAEDILLSWMRSAKSNNIKIPESALKLLIITYLNQSFLYQDRKPLKAIDSAIKANKVLEQRKFKSYKGKLLKFISMLRLCELYIYIEKYDLAIGCAQKVLQDVMKKLEQKNRKKMIGEFGMAAVTAFYRIGICEMSRGMQKAADLAFANANLIGEKYLNKDEVMLQLDYEMITHRQTHRKPIPERPRTSRTIGSEIQPSSPSKDLIFSQTEVNPQPINEILKKKRSISIYEPKEKLPGRYYSSEQLSRLEKMLKEENDFKILNTDNFFFKKISKKLAITDNLKEMAVRVKDSVFEQSNDVWKQKEDLKQKKRGRNYASAKELGNDIKSQIVNIEEKFEEKLKVQDIKMKSKLKTKIYKKLLRSINVPSKSGSSLPAQRLFFRPPEKKIAHGVSVVEEEMEEKTVSVPVINKKIDEFNHEIEDQMEDLLSEINGNQKHKNSHKEMAGNGRLAGSTIKSNFYTDSLKKKLVSIMARPNIPKSSRIKIK